MIIHRGQPLANDFRWNRPLANDHPEGLVSCKWSSWGTGLMQMIIRRDWPLANDHLKGPASLSSPPSPSPFSPSHSPPSPSRGCKDQGSRFNLADLSRTICSCCLYIKCQVFFYIFLLSKRWIRSRREEKYQRACSGSWKVGGETEGFLGPLCKIHSWQGTFLGSCPHLLPLFWVHP